MRNTLFNIVLWWAVISYSVWVGGTLFSMTVVVPMWSEAPPQSVTHFFGTTSFNRHIYNFFGPPWMAARILPVILALGIGWYSRRHRRLLLVSVVTLALGIAYTVAYIYPINEVLMTQAGGRQSAEAIQAMADHWILADRLRFAVMLVGYLTLLMAFRLPVGAGDGKSAAATWPG